MKQGGSHAPLGAGLWFPPAPDPWGHPHALVCFRRPLLSLKREDHLFRWMLAFPGVFSRPSYFGGVSVLSSFMLCFNKTSFAILAFSSLSLHCFLKIRIFILSKVIVDALHVRIIFCVSSGWFWRACLPHILVSSSVLLKQGAKFKLKHHITPLISLSILIFFFF